MSKVGEMTGRGSSERYHAPSRDHLTADTASLCQWSRLEILSTGLPPLAPWVGDERMSSTISMPPSSKPTAKSTTDLVLPVRPGASRRRASKLVILPGTPNYCQVYSPDDESRAVPNITLSPPNPTITLPSSRVVTADAILCWLRRTTFLICTSGETERSRHERSRSPPDL